MTYLQAITLGLLQGLTEFLPVSSSGHLAIAEAFFAIKETALSTIFLHFATLVAVVFYFKVKIIKLSLKQWFFIWVANLPVMVVGFAMRDWLKVSSSNLTLVGWALLITALINFLMQSFLQSKTFVKSKQAGLPSFDQMVKIGLFQILALVPGVSRSGTTIASGLGLKLSRQSAFEFSFLLALPTILVATGYQMLGVWQDGLAGVMVGPLLIASLVAGVTGYFALTWLAQLLKQSNFVWFGVYTGVLGIVVLLVQFF